MMVKHIVLTTFSLALSSVAFCGAETDGLVLLDTIAGRSSDGTVIVGVGFLDPRCTDFAGDEDDWVMAIEDSVLVVRYGDDAAAAGGGAQCGFGPSFFSQWPSLQVVLSATNFVESVPSSVRTVRLEFSRAVCEPAGDDCVPSVARQSLAEFDIGALPRTAARLEGGVWLPRPGVGPLGRPGPNLQVREDGNGLSLVWIGADDQGAANWVFAGGRLVDAAASLPSFSSIAGACGHCRPPDLHLVPLQESTDVWMRSATEIWVSTPARGDRPMEPWRPWSIRDEYELRWLLSEPIGGVSIDFGFALLADLGGEWIDVDRSIAQADGRLNFRLISGSDSEVSYELTWDGGNGQATCGPNGLCVLSDMATGTSISFPISNVGAERIYAPNEPCVSPATCDGMLGGLILLRAN